MAAIVAQSMVAAHAERVPELARLYGLLERAVAADGADGEAARQAHRALSARILDWIGSDMEAERRDVVAVGTADREEMLRAVRRAIAHVQSTVQGVPPLPTSMPRAALIRFRRSAARFETLERLNAPAVIAGNEAGLMLSALESGSSSIPPPDPDFDPGGNFGATFLWGLETCVIREPGASGGLDLGLGTSPAVVALLGVTADDIAALDERWDEVNRRWVGSAPPSHPFARYPFVPRGRFCSVGASGPVRGDLESTGPIGWAGAGDAALLARDLAALAGHQPEWAGELRAASGRIQAAAGRGHAVIGLCEYLPPEADEQRTRLVDE